MNLLSAMLVVAFGYLELQGKFWGSQVSVAVVGRSFNKSSFLTFAEFGN